MRRDGARRHIAERRRDAISYLGPALNWAFSQFGKVLDGSMQVLALSTLRAFWEKHPKARPSLERWYTIVKAADWTSMEEIKAAFSTAKGLNDERMRFEVAGGNFRMIVAFYFPDRMAFIKFIGTHAEYDRFDALTVSQF